jgi:NADH-quinone oxidoreductase subunit E
MTDIKWLPDGQKMFETAIQEIPEIMRDVIREKMLRVAEQKAQAGPIKECHVVEIVKEIVPEPFRGSILKSFAIMGGVDLSSVERIIEQNREGQESLIAILHAVQDRFGYIPREALLLISRKQDVLLSKLYRLVTSYTAFRIEKPEEHIITFCMGTGCHVKGGNNLLKEIESDVVDGGTNITLEKVRCLGCCDMSPAVSIDGEIYSGVDVQAKISEIIGE